MVGKIKMKCSTSCLFDSYLCPHELPLFAPILLYGWGRVKEQAEMIENLVSLLIQPHGPRGHHFVVIGFSC